jgi:hypothetical protein
MSAISEGEIPEDRFLDAVAAIASVEAVLSPIGAAILAAVFFGIAKDSRTFSRKLGIEHALVLREITVLSREGLNFLQIVGRHDRTQRTEIALGDNGQLLLSRAIASK